jgi:hypothetical protein
MKRFVKEASDPSRGLAASRARKTGLSASSSGAKAEADGSPQGASEERAGGSPGLPAGPAAG